MSEGTLLAVTAIGNDRPGIVAAVTRTLYELGCNLEDATSTILRGHFAMMLIVSAPPGLPPEEVERRFRTIARDMHLVITARPVEAADLEVKPPTHVLSVYGSDKPGIVFEITQFLASEGANITDLTSRIIGSVDHPIYALMLEVALPEDPSFEESLRALSERMGVDVSIHPIEPDIL